MKRNKSDEINQLLLTKVNKYKFYAILGWSLLIFFCGSVLIYLSL